MLAAVVMAFSFAFSDVLDISVPVMGTEKTAENNGQPVEPQSGVQISKSYPAEGKEINWQVISGGGDIGVASTNYRLSGTVAQTAAGYGESDNFGLSHGFWQSFGGGVGYLCGDANGDETINVADAVYLIAYIFKGGPAPEPLEAGDANCDETLNVADAVYLITYIFKGGPEPCCPRGMPIG